MLSQIIQNTPRWVWLLLLAVTLLGLSQTRARQVTLKRVTLMPVAMICLSLYGTVTAFGLTLPIALAWLLTGLLATAITLMRGLPSGVSYDRSTGLFKLPGSWVPLTLILAIFLNKYTVAVLTSMHAGLAQEAGFNLTCAALSGVFSGIFLARAARLWRLALQTGPVSNQDQLVGLSSSVAQ